MTTIIVILCIIAVLWLAGFFEPPDWPNIDDDDEWA